MYRYQSGDGVNSNIQEGFPLRIKIIEPCYRDKRYGLRGLTPSAGPVVIASLLKENGHDVEVISEYVTEFDLADVENVDLVGISITTYNATRGYEIAGQIDKPVVFGGFHASLMPEESLDHGDYVIRGDGFSFVQLAEYLQGNKDIQLSDIPNLVYRDKGQIVSNNLASQAANIVPDYSLVRDYFRPGLNRFLRIPLLVNASRGCTFNCSFCSIKSIWTDFAKNDVAVIIEDIQRQIDNQHFLSTFFPKILWITDDNFTSDRIWAKALLTELAKLKTRYKFVIQARVDIADDDELLSLMSQTNIKKVYLGIEAINQKSLDRFNKKIAVDDTVIAIKKIQSYGIGVQGLFVFGDDAFHKGDGLRVAEFIKKNRLCGALLQPLTSFPGTDLFNRLDGQNRIINKNWHDYSGKVVFQPKNMTPAELQHEISMCYRFIYSPIEVVKYLLFGPRGFRLKILGEALIRYMECFKYRRHFTKN